MSTAPTNVVTFTINGKQYTAVNPEPYTTLNDFIRAQPDLKGTKHNCGQAGCGVCSVVISYKDPGTGKTVTVPCNSCVRPLISCHGQAVTTVEGIGNPQSLHPVQETLAANNGSQCGFCTSGMVCTMYGLLQKNPNPLQSEVVEALDGNLCRCTGYRPIVAAFTSFGRDHVDVPKATNGRCCSAVKETFPDIEELGLRLPEKKYCHGDHALHPKLPTVKQALAIEGRENNWVTVTTINDLVSTLQSAPVGYQLVVGNTSSGLYPMPIPKLYINIQPIAALYGFTQSGQNLIIGANQTLTSLQDYFDANSSSLPAKFAQMSTFLKRVASFNIRNVGTWAGNVMLVNGQDFLSDVYTMLVAAGATITVVDSASPNTPTTMPMSDFAAYNMNRKYISFMTIPFVANEVYWVQKTALRSRFAHSLVNFGASVIMNGTTVKSITLVVGGFPSHGVLLPKTANLLVGQDVTKQATIDAAIQSLVSELGAPGTPHPEYRTNCVQSLMYKLLLTLQPNLPPSLQSAVTPFRRAVSTGHQTYQNPGDPSEGPVSYPIPKLMEKEQVSGKTVYTNDEPTLPGTLYASPVYSTVSVADIQSIDASSALSLPGVIAFYSSKDLPDPNFKWGGFQQDEPLFASTGVVCAGQLIGIIVAEDQVLADMATKFVNVTYANQKTPILTIDEAIAKNSFYQIPGQNYPIKVGDPDSAFAKSANVITGSMYMGSQTHFQMEPQTFYSIPQEAGTVKMLGAFQFQAFVQQVTAAALQMPMGKITVETRRIGGAYGCKITRPAGLAAATTLAAMKLNKPVKMVMRIEYQNDMIGKRNQFKTDYKIGFGNDGRVNAISVTIYQQSGAFFDGDNFSMAAAVTTISNCYTIPNWYINGVLCKTNIPAQTSVRGPGWTNGVCLSEAMFEDVASFLKMDPLTVKQLNLAKPGDMTPYQQPLEYFPLNSMLTQLQATSNYFARKQEIDQYNLANRWTKRGISFVPARFNVLNANDPFGALICAYADGTVQISVGGVEVGQGLNTKVAQAAAYALGCPLTAIYIRPVTTAVNPNEGATGGSVTSELCVSATMSACQDLMKILGPFIDQNPNGTWAQWCGAAVAKGIDLRATGRALFPQPSTPDSYQTYGACITEVFVDLLTGETQTLRSDVLMDLGISMNPLLDVGQIEGAFMMGVGLTTQEDVTYNDDGTLFTRDTWEYKIPGVMDVPIDWRVSLLANAPNPKGVLRSRAVGEPPLLMGCSVFYAIRYAVSSARQQVGKTGRFNFYTPSTVPATLNALVANGVSIPQNFKLQ